MGPNASFGLFRRLRRLAAVRSSAALRFPSLYRLKCQVWQRSKHLSLQRGSLATLSFSSVSQDQHSASSPASPARFNGVGASFQLSGTWVVNGFSHGGRPSHY